MRLEGLFWFIIGGLVLNFSIYYVVLFEPDPLLAIIFGLIFGFGAFFFMGLGLIMLIKEITKSAVT